MSMISNAVITGGDFSLINDHRQVYVTQAHIRKSAVDRLQEAVAHTAFHNSGERFDPPKCHLNTRVAVRDKIEKWALHTDPDTRDASILWLCGAAGAGKSAIAQTVAEEFHSRGILLASFFFGRSDPTRNHARSLVATIAYQLYTLLPPPDQGRVLAVIERDPLIFTKSLLAQFEALVVNPLRHLWEWSNITPPCHVIIIDGLDECLDHGMQRNVLLMLCASIQRFHLPFVFLLASRPEHDIQAVFSSLDFLSIHTRLFLDATYLPDRDIKLFLRDQFEECRTTHRLKHTIPRNWPSEDIVNKITRKSSGQFVYASVVAKYVKSSRHRPHHRLDVVMDIRPASRDLPFSELDALYTHIFSSVNDIGRVLDVISFPIIFTGNPHYVEDIEAILQLNPGDIDTLLCDLPSVLSLENGSRGQPKLKLLHASLADYLVDSARSNEYFIDVVKHRTNSIANCFQFLSTACFDSCRGTVCIAMSYFIEGYLLLAPTESLYNVIRRFSTSPMLDSLLGIDGGDLVNFKRPVIYPSADVICRFLPALFTFLQKSNSPKYLELYQHYQSVYDAFHRASMKTYLPGAPLHLLLALITIRRRIPAESFHRAFCLVDISQVHPQAWAVFQYISWPFSSNYVDWLSSFLRDQKRSQEFCAGPTLFAQAAKHCLLYLCDHRAAAQKAPPRTSWQQRIRRKHTPWKWHRRVLRQDIRGPDDTPWLWLNRSVSEMYTLHRKTNDLVYAHDPDLDDFFWGIENELLTWDPVINHRIFSEKYHLALKFLNYFLPRAAKLDELVHKCQTLTLASRSQDFPRKSARARANMHEYAARWE